MTQSKRFTILVTGGAGYIGSHAVLALLDAGWRVVVVDNLLTGFRWAVPEQALFVEADVSDTHAIRRVLTEHDIGAVMHFAGSVVVPESMIDPLKYYRNNTAASQALLEIAISKEVRHFIFSSTAAVYGLPLHDAVNEDSEKIPINPYGMSKLMTEIMLGHSSKAYSINYCALRYFNVAGADPAGRSGQSTAGATHLIKIAVEAALGKRTSVSVFGTDYATPDGTGVRDYIHVTDLAQAHVLALEHLIANPATNMTMNCGYGRGYSVTEVLDAIDRVAPHRIERKFEPRRSGDPDRLVADTSLINATLPWRPQRANLDTIVADAMAWERKLIQRDR